MLFNTLDFAVFLPIVFLIYWSLNSGSLKFQNLFVVLASYVFYGWWDWRFLTLIFFSNIVDYILGIALSREHNQLKKKILLWPFVILMSRHS